MFTKSISQTSRVGIEFMYDFKRFPRRTSFRTTPWVDPQHRRLGKPPSHPAKRRVQRSPALRTGILKNFFLFVTPGNTTMLSTH